MPMNRDKRAQLKDDPYFAGKKLRKGGHQNDLGLVMRGGGGEGRDGGFKNTWKMFPWPHKKYQPLGLGTSGPYGGMLPGPGFHPGEDEFNRKHRKLEEKWGLRRHRVEEGHIYGRGPMPPPGYPPIPLLPEFLHAPRRSNRQFRKLRRHRRDREEDFGHMRAPPYDRQGFDPRFDDRQPHRYHDPHPPYPRDRYPSPYGRYSPNRDRYPTHHDGYDPYYGGRPGFGGSMGSRSTDSLFGAYSDDDSSYTSDSEDGWGPGYYSGDERAYAPRGGRYGYSGGLYDLPGGRRYDSPGPYALSNSSTNSLRNRFINHDPRGRRY